MSDNHEYNLPSEGARDWHILLNENFKSIDTDVEIRDLQANISEYEPKDGAKYSAIDTKNVYFGDGSRWQKGYRVGSDFDELASGNILLVGETTGRQTLDPTTSTTPVRDAIETIHSNYEGGLVRLPPTTIEHAAGTGNEILMRPGISVIGTGGWELTGCSTIKRTTAGDLIVYGGEATQSSPTKHTELANIYLDGRYTAEVGTATGSAIVFAPETQPYQNWLHSLAIRKWGDSAIRGDNDFYATTLGPNINCRLIDPNNAESGRAIVDMVTSTTGLAASTVGNYFMGINELYGHTSPPSGTDCLAMHLAGSWMIDSMQVGGSTDQLLAHSGKSLVAKRLYWEPNERTGSDDADWLIRFDDTFRAWIGDVEMTTDDATINGGYRLVGFGSPPPPIGNLHLPEIFVQDDASLNGYQLTVDTDVTGPVIYEGDSADVTNETGVALTHPVTCLGDLTLVN